MKIYLSAATATFPDLAGLDVELLPTVYMGRHTALYGHPWHPFVRCLEADNVTTVYDEPSCDAVGAHLVRHGVRYAVFDWEQVPYTFRNRTVYGLILRRLRRHGLEVGRFGLEPRIGFDDDVLTRASDGPLHWNPYQFSPDLLDWLADKQVRLAEVRDRFPGRDIVGWVNDLYEVAWDVYDGKPVRRGEPVEADKVAAQLLWLRECGVTPCLFVRRNTPEGDFDAFPEDSPGWRVAKALAKA